MFTQLFNDALSIDMKTIFASIREEGFNERTIKIIDYYTSQILTGKTNLAQFNQAEHAGLCCAGEVLIGAYIVCNYATASLTAGEDVGTSQAGPASWEIDLEQEKLVHRNHRLLSPKLRFFHRVKDAFPATQWLSPQPLVAFTMPQAFSPQL